MLGSDLLLKYEHLSGELGPAGPDLPSILSHYGRPAITISAAGDGSIEPGGRTGDAPGFKDLVADLERPQRERVDDLRENILTEPSTRGQVWAFFDTAIDSELANSANLGEAARSFLARYHEVPIPIPPDTQSTAHLMKEFLRTDIRTAYLHRMKSLDGKTAVEFERRVLLTVLNQQWAQHLARLDQALALAGSSDTPWSQASEQYRRASHQSEQRMWMTVTDDAIGYLFHAHSSA
jgi:preprotein translocase subunit SecA